MRKTSVSISLHDYGRCYHQCEKQAADDRDVVRKAQADLRAQKI